MEQSHFLSDFLNKIFLQLISFGSEFIGKSCTKNRGKDNGFSSALKENEFRQKKIHHFQQKIFCQFPKSQIFSLKISFLIRI